MKTRAYAFCSLALAALALFAGLAFCPQQAQAADQWNQVFAQPRYFETVQGVHLRKGPSTNSGIMATLKQGTPLRASAIENGWHKVTTREGETGYVYKRFLRSLPAGASAFDGAVQQAPQPAETPAAQDDEPLVSEAPASAAEPAGDPAEEAPVEPPMEPKVEPAAEPVGEPVAEPVIDEEPLLAPQPSTAEHEKAPQETPVISAEPVAEPAAEPVPAPAPPEDPVVTEGADCKRIKFQPGAVSGSVERSLPAGGQHCYLLGVSSNQWMEVWLTSVQDNAAFQIYSPAGVSVTAGETHWLGRTDATGDYVILVSSVNEGEASYNLKIQIK